MLEDVVVVQSAISAFNNAALWGPAFLWWALLAVPLFVLVYLCKDVLMECIGWNKNNVIEKSAPWVVALTAIWVVLMGGNYAVLRDGATILPVVTALILFLSTWFFVARMRGIALPVRKGFLGVLSVVTLLMVVVMSGIHTWWEPLLQVGAVLFGGLLGRLFGNKINNLSFVCYLMLLVVSAVLMQPEFFRFGQLGNLTVFHLVGALLFALVLTGALVVKNVQAVHKIRNSVYVKLKWLLRTFEILAVAFFVLTEALPVFFAALVVAWLMFVVSVRHQRVVSSDFVNQLFAVGLFLFGVITVMPVISVIGIFCWRNNSICDFWRNVKELL